MDIYTAYDLLNQPQLSVETLVQIANDVPEYQVYVAAHPSATVELLQWLGQSADPNVVAAVSARLGTQAPGPGPVATPVAGGGAAWGSPVEESTTANSTVAPPSTGVAAAAGAGAGAVGAKKSLGGGAIAGIIIAAVAALAVIGLVVGNQVTGGSLFGGDSPFGGGVSREQGCINLRDALLDDSYDADATTEQYMEEIFSGDTDADGNVSGMGNLMGDWMSTVSGKIGNREVRDVWDEYVDLITNMSFEDIYVDDSLEGLEGLMAKENEILTRLGELCPGLQYELPTY